MHDHTYLCVDTALTVFTSPLAIQSYETDDLRVAVDY